MKQLNLQDKNVQLRLAWILLAVIACAYTIWMSYETILRYDTFKATAFDLGNMDQAIWNTIHGRPFQFTNQGADWYGPPTRLGFHVEPILFLISLLYLFHADPRILLVFQTIVLATGALPVFLLTRKYLPEWPLFAPIMVLAYLLSPALMGVNLFDFHPLSLATPLLLYAVLALERKCYAWFLLACILAAATKEDVPLTIATLGILVLWKYKLPRLGLVLIVGGILWTTIAFAVVIPQFDPGALHNNYWYRYADLGSSPGAAVVNLLLHPWLLFTVFFTLNRLYYLASLVRSTGFLALLAPEWLLPTLPSLAVNLLSADSLLHSGVYHYNATIIPFVMIAAIHGTRRLLSTWMAWRGEAILPLVEGAHIRRGRRGSEKRTTQGSSPVPTGLWHNLTHAFVASPAFVRSSMLIQPRLGNIEQRGKIQWQRFSQRMTPLAQEVSTLRLQVMLCTFIVAMIILNIIIMTPLLNIFWADHLPGDREQHIQQLLAMIPPNASVSASDNLNPHLTERLYVTVFPATTFSSSGKSQNESVQYIIVDLNAFFPEERVSATNELNQLRQSGQFRNLAQAEGVILLVRVGT